LIYRVPNDRINEAIEFVKEIDFKELVPKFIDELEKKFDEKLA
jgi:hypothetical protein